MIKKGKEKEVKVLYGLRHKKTGNLLGLSVSCFSDNEGEDCYPFGSSPGYELEHSNPSILIWLVKSREEVEYVMNHNTSKDHNNSHDDYNKPGNSYKAKDLEIVEVNIPNIRLQAGEFI